MLLPGRARQGLAKATVAARGLAGLGPRTAAATVVSTLELAARRRRARRLETTPALARTPGRLVAVVPLTDGARCRFTEGEVEVRYLAPELVRVSWGPDEPPLPWATDGPAGFPPPAVDVAGDAVTGCVLRATGGVGVDVTVEGSLCLRDAAGTVLRHELPPVRRGPARTTRFRLRPGERLAGLGEQSSPADLAGTTHRLWNRDPGGSWGPGVDPLYCGVPVLVGLHEEGSVLAFYENSYDATVRAEGDRPGLDRHVSLTFAGGMLRHYLAAGPLPLLLDRLTALTGRPPLPPRWALGYHQSRWGYRDQAEVRQVAEGFAAEGLPLSAVHLDIDHLDGYRVFTVDGRRFPDLPGLAADLGRQGSRLVAIVDPAVKVDPGYDVYREGDDGGHFVADEDGGPLRGVVWPGRAAFPDFTAPATRQWWGGWYRVLAARGLAGVWHDMNEPTWLSLAGDRTLPRGARHDAEGRGADHRECHNPYGALMDRAGWEGLAAARPDRRPFVLSRAGWAGVQRWAWQWTGDSESTWEGLAQQVPTLLGMGLSGLAFTGPDIGGFSGTPGPELYLRWLELAVLVPFCRTHSVLTAPPREPWRFGEPHRAAIGRLIRFRYRLLPYLYTLAHEASETGAPLVRPLGWPDTPALADDAFLLGDDLLVAPALQPGTADRRLALPPGRWVRWRPAALPGLAPGPGGPVAGTPVAEAPVAETDGALDGGQVVRVDTPLGQPALFVRAGTVLPLDDGPVALDDGHRPGLLAFHCFPDDDGLAGGRCYDDAGDGYGPWRLDHLALAPGAGGPHLDWQRQGEYAPPDLVRVVRHPADGSPVPPMVRESAPFARLDLIPRG